MIKIEETLDLNFKNDSETDSSVKDQKTSNIKKKTFDFYSKFKLLNSLKSILKNFLKFYGLRVLLELMKKILKHQTNIFKYSLTKILKIIFNLENVRTGLFLTILPGLYKIFNFFLEEYFTNETEDKTNKNENENENNRTIQIIITFLSGFFASFIAIFFAEKADIMNFIILSIMFRSLHSLIVVYLKKNGYPSQSKFAAWLVYTFASFGILFLVFAHPSFKPLKKLFDRFALYTGKEKEEQNYLSSLITNK